MLCKRCNFELGEPVFGWSDCPKCHLAKFTPGVQEPVKEEEKEVLEPVVEEEKKNDDNETVEEDQE